ncbi:hypothetical protein [Streptomyces sp. NPDC059744]|uniref:hypothetical protein n=1 Tax=Streptomyces sp. NPDC059744 TaxID=3346929 RepID=UPI00365BD527
MGGPAAGLWLPGRRSALLYQALDLLQHLLATWTGTCPTCRQPTPWQPHDTT